MLLIISCLMKFKHAVFLHKLRVVVMEYITITGFSEDIIFPDELRKAPRRKGETQVLLLFYTSISIPQVSRKTILN